MHKEVMTFCKGIKEKYKEHFKKGISVLDVGSLDINGTNKYLFEDITESYFGIDVIEGKNVDIIGIAHTLNLEPNQFDIIISTNALEHDMYYKQTIAKMIEWLKPGGLLIISVAGSWPEHGTKQHQPGVSGTSKISEEWANYYKNITVNDLKLELLPELFTIYELDEFRSDTRFVGVKK